MSQHLSKLYPNDHKTEKDTFVMALKEYANRLEYFPLQKIILSSGSFCVDDFFAESKEGRVFYDFMDFARRATENDLQECVDYLKLATPKERCLLLIVLHCSLNTKYLPVIAEYVNDHEKAFPTEATYEEMKIDQTQNFSIVDLYNSRDDFFNPRRIRILLDGGEKISGLEKMYVRKVFGQSIGPNSYFSDELNDTSPGGKSVAQFARAILGMWGCIFGEYKTERYNSVFRDWSMPSEDYWEQYESRQHLFCYYTNMYMTQVECSQPEDFDNATKIFLNKVEDIPTKFRILVLMQNGLFQHAYNNKTDKQIFVIFTPTNYPFPCCYNDNIAANALSNERQYVEEWMALLKTIPKEELLELMTTKTPETIDPEICNVFLPFGRIGYSLLKQIIVQYQDSLFTAGEIAMF